MRELTQFEVELVLWLYGRLGGFKYKLWELICNADSSNLRQLALAYPGQVDAYQRYIGEAGYWDEVKFNAIHGGCLNNA